MSFGGLVAGTVGLPFFGLIGARTFGTSLTAAAGVSRGTGNGVIAYAGLGLGARVGTFDMTGVAADSGVLSSGVPGADQSGLPVNFGRGRGRWTPDDLLRLRVEIVNPDGRAGFSNLHVAMISVTTAPTVPAPLPLISSGFRFSFTPRLLDETVFIVGSAMPRFGDLVIGIHSRSAAAASDFGLHITYDHSIPRGG